MCTVTQRKLQIRDCNNFKMCGAYLKGLKSVIFCDISYHLLSNNLLDTMMIVVVLIFNFLTITMYIDKNKQIINSIYKLLFTLLGCEMSLILVTLNHVCKRSFRYTYSYVEIKVEKCIFLLVHNVFVDLFQVSALLVELCSYCSILREWEWIKIQSWNVDLSNHWRRGHIKSQNLQHVCSPARRQTITKKFKQRQM